jgi:thiol-disulfide isomerase/thioredoxin
MTLKKYLNLSLVSILICFSLTPLGGYGGHHLKFLAATIIYYGLCIFFLRKLNSKKEILYTVLILIAPPALLFIPIHLLHFKETQISLLSTLGHFVGLLFGIFAHFIATKLKVILTILLLTLSIWVAFFGFSYCENKVNFGTFTGKVSYNLPCNIEGRNQYGQSFSEINSKNKILVLDFWHTRCGVCFRKFPIVQELFETYKRDTSILILAINKHLEEDTTGQAFDIIKKNGYNFPVLLPSDDKLPENFNVNCYPTTFIIDKKGKIIFKGDIQFVKSILADLKKNDW